MLQWYIVFCSPDAGSLSRSSLFLAKDTLISLYEKHFCASSGEVALLMWSVASNL